MCFMFLIMDGKKHLDLIIKITVLIKDFSDAIWFKKQKECPLSECQKLENIFLSKLNLDKLSAI